MAQGVGIVTCQGPAATPTGGRLAQNGLAHLVGGNEQTLRPGMAGLTTVLWIDLQATPRLYVSSLVRGMIAHGPPGRSTAGNSARR